MSSGSASCLDGEFYSVKSSSCVPCPPSSVSSNTVVHSCSCYEGHSSSGFGDNLVCTQSTSPSSLVIGKKHVWSSPGNYDIRIEYDGVLRIKMWGGGGSGGSISTNGRTVSYAGGSAGFTTCDISVSAGETFQVIVAGGGGPCSSGKYSSPGGFGGGGGSSWGSGWPVPCLGGGGGRSAIRKKIGEDDLATAGGGGGGGGFNANYYFFGGGGCGGGLEGCIATEPYQGGGGSQTEGGKNGAKYEGGIGVYGGGGGGGYYGGGGGSTTYAAAHSGGGGSGYIGGCKVATGHLFSGQSGGLTAVLPARIVDPDYIAGVGIGSAGINDGMPLQGGNGLIVTQLIPSDEPNFTKYDRLISGVIPWAIYDAHSWNITSPSVLPDARNAGGREAFLVGSIYQTFQAGNGTSFPIWAIGGNTSAEMTFPAGSIPPSFTYCSKTRYSGPNQQRVLASSGDCSFIHGHWGGNLDWPGVKRGAAYYGDWFTDPSHSVGEVTDWLVMCGKGSITSGATMTPGNILNDGIPVGVKSISVPTDYRSCVLSINKFKYEFSDWEFSELVIYDQLLTDHQMQLVSSTMIDVDSSVSYCHEGEFFSMKLSSCVSCPVNSSSSMRSYSCSCYESYSSSGFGDNLVCTQSTSSSVALGTYLWVNTAFSQKWTCIASSADGTKLAATSWGGYIYTSADSGTTWTQTASSQNWNSIASSSDGTKLAAVVSGGTIWIMNSDSSWTQTAIIFDAQKWRDIAISADGRKLVAAVGTSDGSKGYIYTGEYDDILSWKVATPLLGVKNWGCLASSADGTKLAAGEWGGFIYVSSDGGVTWIERGMSLGPQQWQGLASSNNGIKLAIASNTVGGYVYTSSDSGVTWVQRTTSFGSQKWQDVTISADGIRLAAVNWESYIYTSSDEGETWDITASPHQWFRVASYDD